MNVLIASISNVRCYLRSLMFDLSRLFPENRVPSLALDDLTKSNTQRDWKSVLQDIIGDGFLYGAPKSRRTIERRLRRRINKLMVPKQTLICCETCGHFYPIHAVCGNCYEKIKEETQFMQRAIVEKLKLKPIENEVIVLYNDDLRSPKLVQGKHIVELPTVRPPWFSKNLLQRSSGTNQEPAKSLSDSQVQLPIKD